MVKIKSALLIIACIKLFGCTVINNKVIKPPMENYVKVFHKVEIISCKQKTKNECATGTYLTSGSGMAINISEKYKFGFILTAKHVCDTALPDSVSQSIQTNKIMDHKGNLHIAYVIMNTELNEESGTSDLCLMYSPTLKKRGVKFSRIPPRVGDRIYYVGSPAGVYHPPVAPIIDGIFSGNLSSTSAMATCAAIGGASGSAVLNQNNKIIGLLFAAHPTFHHVTIISSYDSLRDFLKEATRFVDSI